jgi:hypothetical protein
MPKRKLTEGQLRRVIGLAMRDVENWELDRLIDECKGLVEERLEEADDAEIREQAEWLGITEDGEIICCCFGARHKGKCCPGWNHFNASQNEHGHIVSDIERCDECDRFEDDEAALAEHDAVCQRCRPATMEDADFIVADDDPTPTGLRLSFCRITKRPAKSISP